MEKITIKINHVALEVLCETFNEGSYQGVLSPEQKVIMSIIADLSLQLEKKEISKRHTTKKFKMSFKYHEAFALEKHCRMVYANFYQCYTTHVALDVANQIDQQL
ncbi:MAG TPA: hypothetical protein VL022_04755 [Moheibacter sp.]|nr:hypothetical protein [Moheibacter sp.]